MGCLGTIIASIFSFFYYIFVGTIRLIGLLVMVLITGIISLIKYIIKSNNAKKSNNYNKTNYYQNNLSTTRGLKSKNISNIETKTSLNPKENSSKNITNSYSYLKLYTNKKHQGVRKNDELNYKLLGIESYDAPTVYYDEFAEVKGYNVFEADECSSEKYCNLLEKIQKLCGNDFYATIGYEEKQVSYKITIKDNIIYLNGKDIQSIKDRYLYLKNKIISFSDNLYDYFIYIEDDNYYYDVVPNDDLDCDSIEILANKL